MGHATSAAHSDNDTVTDAEARLEKTIRAMRSGNADGARDVATAAVETFPSEMRILHKAGVVMRLCGDGEAALRLFNRALGVHPNYHFTEIEIANVYAASGEKEEALCWYRKAIDSNPDYPLSYIRAARLERELGHIGQGLQLLDTLHDRSSANIDGNLLRAEFLLCCGRRVEAARAYEEAISAGCDDWMALVSYIRTLTELADYRGLVDYVARLTPSAGSPLMIHAAAFAGHAKLALDVNTTCLVSEATARQQSQSWLSAGAVLSRLKTAIDAELPLSLIRLGDGEARFAAFFDVRARNLVSQREAESILDLHWQNWFGQSLGRVTPTDLSALADAFSTALGHADILGVTSATRLQKDAIHRGYLGVLERVVKVITTDHPNTAVTDAFVQIDLHRLSPFYATLLSGLDFLGVISPHPGLAANLRRHHGIAEFREYVIPGESRLPASAQGRLIGSHFPDRYHEILTQLQVPKPGAVFLVAAGLLGKIYCHRIKELGGIAIDVGSIVDAWMGFNTRPGQYEPPEHWRLPTATSAVAA
jgi:tetratricopeptide (TPR) repeat protein